MKKIISMILLVLALGAMSLGLVSCGNKTVEYGPYTIGIVHSGTTTSAKNATINCIKSLQIAIGSDDLTIYIMAETQELATEIKNGSGNEHNEIVKASYNSDLKKGLEEWFKVTTNDKGQETTDNVKGIQTIIATSNKAVDVCKEYIKIVPVVGNAVSYSNSYEKTGLKTDENGMPIPDGNGGYVQIVEETVKIPSSLSIATGTNVFEYLERVVGDFTGKKVAFIYDKSNIDSISHVGDIERELDKKGYAYAEYDITQYQEAFENAIVYVVHDDRTVANASKIQELNKENVLVITQSEELFDVCGDKAFTINHDVVGTNAANIAFDILVNGKDYNSASNINNKLVAVATERSK